MLKLSKDSLNIIVAFTEKEKYIALDDNFPWGNLKGDFLFLKYLMKLEKEAIFIMGRKTYEIAKMKNFKKIVITKTIKKNEENTIFTDSFDKALELAKKKFIIIFGGQEIYRKALLKKNVKIFATIVKGKEMNGNRIFPLEDKSINKMTNIDENVKNIIGNQINYSNNSFIEKEYKYNFYIIEINN